jgi:hypothetical protein
MTDVTRLLENAVEATGIVQRFVLLLFAPFANSKWPSAEVKVCIETLWETTFSSSS